MAEISLFSLDPPYKRLWSRPTDVSCDTKRDWRPQCLAFFVALCDADGDLKQFDESSIKDPEQSQSKVCSLWRWGQRKGENCGTPGVVFAWLTIKDPVKTHLNSGSLRGQSLPISEDPHSRSCHHWWRLQVRREAPPEVYLISSKNPETKETMPIAAFKGTAKKEDWQTNMTCNQETMFATKGSFTMAFSCIRIIL